MPDLNRMDRTWLCSVLFMDIVAYSSQSVELQIRLKQRFNHYLGDAIQDVPESERVLLDTGDGAAVCFLGAPEAAMFTALKLWQVFIQDKQQQQPGLRVRLGINLGPVKLVKDINGALNAIGDGMNAGQRIMSFAAENQILVSQSYYEVVSRLSDDYKALFKLKGIETDKHIREHMVYHLLPPRSKGSSVASRPPSRRRIVPLVLACMILAALAVAGTLLFVRTPVKPSTPVAVPISQAASLVPPPVAVTIPDPPKPRTQQPAIIPHGRQKATEDKATEEKAVEDKVAEDKAAGDMDEPPPASKSKPANAPSAEAAAEYNEGKRLIDANHASDAVPHFDRALKGDSEYIEALVGRAEALRMLNQYDRSMEDCNRIVAINKDDARGYNCRGLANHLIKRYEASLPDFNQAIRLNQTWAFAYANRAIAYNGLQKYDEAVRDFNMAVRLRPKNTDFRLRRAVANMKLMQYAKAIDDYAEVIRLQPENLRAYRGRAAAEEASGDVAAATADRRHAKGPGKQ